MGGRDAARVGSCCSWAEPDVRRPASARVSRVHGCAPPAAQVDARRWGRLLLRLLVSFVTGGIQGQFWYVVSNGALSRDRRAADRDRRGDPALPAVRDRPADQPHALVRHRDGDCWPASSWASSPSRPTCCRSPRRWPSPPRPWRRQRCSTRCDAGAARVDRRFNRARYDGEAIVRAFTSRLQDAVDLETVRAPCSLRCMPCSPARPRSGSGPAPQKPRHVADVRGGRRARARRRRATARGRRRAGRLRRRSRSRRIAGLPTLRAGAARWQGPAPPR